MAHRAVRSRCHQPTARSRARPLAAAEELAILKRELVGSLRIGRVSSPRFRPETGEIAREPGTPGFLRTRQRPQRRALPPIFLVLQVSPQCETPAILESARRGRVVA